MIEKPLQIVITRTYVGYKVSVMGLDDTGNAVTLRNSYISDLEPALEATGTEMPRLHIPEYFGH